MENSADLLEQLYRLRKDFLIIGLTGRLGSGCSSIANLLTKERFEECEFPIPQNDNFGGNEDRKYRIVYNYLKENWLQFTLIRASDIIVCLLLKENFADIKSFIGSKYSVIGQIDWVSLEQEFNTLKVKHEVENLFKKSSAYEFSDDAYKTVIGSGLIGNFSSRLKEYFKDLIASDIGSPFQYFGDNIRKTGKPLSDVEGDINVSNSYIIADLIKQLIKQLRNVGGPKHNLRIVIDSIRNSFEARFFRERYAAFYLFAVNTEDKFRTERLSNHLSKDQILNLDIEYLKDLKTKQTFYKQDIKSCIQMSDVYLHNPNDESSCGDKFKTLKKSLVRYLTLIYQPGIITPTSVERTMQVAYTAKYNSGCISRQVGAVITDKDFSIKSIGWNNTPQGQTPCLLRNAEDLVKNTDNISFSEYEKSDSDIKKYVDKSIVSNVKKLNGLNPCFCFKQVQNAIEGEKNQVHTRSLHAEENAMLQISKYGGEGLQEGNLFTTASPCELCSKKAYQLGIKNIYYIDPYPGIAEKQILRTGSKTPALHLFNGAVGKAYHAIFEPFMPYKDEIEIKLDVDFKKSRESVNVDKSQRFKDNRVKDLQKIIQTAQKEIEALNENSIERKPQ